jgi:hypothetical protein
MTGTLDCKNWKHFFRNYYIVLPLQSTNSIDFNFSSSVSDFDFPSCRSIAFLQIDYIFIFFSFNFSFTFENIRNLFLSYLASWFSTKIEDYHSSNSVLSLQTRSPTFRPSLRSITSRPSFRTRKFCTKILDCLKSGCPLMCVAPIYRLNCENASKSCTRR